jgi:hypothetical protein
MSNHRAVAAVTAAFSARVQEAIDGLLPMNAVTNTRPGVAVGTVSSPSVNVYLYRAVPNASLRNLADPVRLPDGRLVRRPVAAWDLCYLLSFVGIEAELEPDLLCGAVLTALSADPLLSQGFVATVETALLAEAGNRRFAAGSELPDQVQVVRLTPIDLSVETMAQLWGSLTSEPYTLSLAWQAGAVLMTAELEPRPSLPVGGRPTVALGTIGTPRLSRLQSSEGELSPILVTSTLILEGEGLRADHVQLRLADLSVDLSLASVSPRRIEVDLALLSVRPGAWGLQIRHLVDVSTDPLTPLLRPGTASNVLPIVLRPEIVGLPSLGVDVDGDACIVIETSPAPLPDEEHLLFLNERLIPPDPTPPRALTLSRWSIDSGSVPHRLNFKSSSVAAGDWLLRLQVNGAESPLSRDPSGAFVGPLVTL